MADENKTTTKYLEFTLKHKIGDEEIIANMLAELFFPILPTQVYYRNPRHDSYSIILPSTALEDLPDIEARGIGCGETLIKLKLTTLRNRISSELEKELDKLYTKIK